MSTQTIELTPIEPLPGMVAWGGTSLRVEARTMKCDTAESLKICGDLLALVKKDIRHKKAQAKRLLTAVNVVTTIVKEMLAVSIDEQEAFVVIVTPRMAAEQDRQKALTRERLRKEQEEADRVLQAKRDAEVEEMRRRAEADDVTKKQAKEILEAADEIVQEPAPIAKVPEKPGRWSRTVSTGGVSRREYPYGVVNNWTTFLTWILEDLDARIDYISVNTSKAYADDGRDRKSLNADAKELGELFAIPGCERKVRSGYSG